MATKRVDLRLDDVVLKLVYEFQYEHKLDSPSTAIRALLEIALRDYRTVDEALRRSLWRESVRRSNKEFREKLDALVAEVLGVADKPSAKRDEG